MKKFNTFLEEIGFCAKETQDMVELREVYQRLSAEAAKLGVELKWVEIKETVFFYPVLPSIG